MMLVLFAASVAATSLFANAHALATFLTDAAAFNFISSVLAAGPVDKLAKAIDDFVDTLKGIGRPAALISLTLLFLSWIFSGVLPDWAQQNKGVLMKVVMGAVLIGIAPDIVDIVLPE